MLHKLKLIFYYSILYNLPNSRFFFLFSNLRVLYLSKVLDIMPYDSLSKIEERVYISDCSNIKIGSNCRINENVFIQGAFIGNDVLIAPNCSLLSVSHIHKDRHISIIQQGETQPDPPVIEDNVWLGRNVVVLPGVKIGEGSIIGAGAIVNKDVEPFSIYGGVPAKLIKRR